MFLLLLVISLLLDHLLLLLLELISDMELSHLVGLIRSIHIIQRLLYLLLQGLVIAIGSCKLLLLLHQNVLVCGELLLVHL